MAQRLTITGAETISLGIVDADKQGIAVVVAGDANLDSGTITIAAKTPDEADGVAEDLDATLIAAASATYTVGSGIELLATTDGAGASVELLVAQY